LEWPGLHQKRLRDRHSIAIYTWTVESTDNYWVVIDNSNAISGGTNSGQEVTFSSGYVDITDSIFI